MRWLDRFHWTPAILATALAASAPAASMDAAAGQTFLITRSYETRQQSSSGNSGSSSGTNALIEKVIAVRDDGIEVEYDLPGEADAAARAREWTLPARVILARQGGMRLVNGNALNARLEQWLASAGWDRKVCGRWIFTWNAFKIECDPQSVLKTIEAYDLRSIAAKDGAEFGDSAAAAPVRLERKTSAAGKPVFEARLILDPKKFHRAEAESDVVTGEITGQPITFDTALARRSKDKVDGTISVVLETNADGEVIAKTRTTKVRITHPDGTTEVREAIETLHRTRPAGASALRDTV